MASAEHIQPDRHGVPLPPCEPAFALWIDGPAPIVRATISDVRTSAQTDEYIAELSDIVEESRRRFGHARILSDRRACTPMSEASVARFGLFNATLTPEDRLAVVVGSSLAKAQFRRTFVHAGSQAFLSCTAAELWLTAWP